MQCPLSLRERVRVRAGMFTMRRTIVSVVLLVVVGLWFLIGLLPRCLYPTILEAAAFGDSFGCVNSLFAGLAFAFVALALILQIREIAIMLAHRLNKGGYNWSRFGLPSELLRFRKRCGLMRIAGWQ
jgi:hypothetical protein